MKFILSERQRAILEGLSKPSTSIEIRGIIRINRNTNLSSALKRLCKLRLLHCMSHESKTGRVYGLTPSGIKLRRQLLKNGNYTPYTEPNLNWSLYSWVVGGKQKKAILKGMKRPLPLKYIKGNAQLYNERISSMNTHDVLRLFVRKGIAQRSVENGRIIYILTKMGERIRDQLISNLIYAVR
jgi:predicted transcriptional regulator